jgi:hypothetical protein
MQQESPEARIAITQRGKDAFDRESFGFRTQSFAFHDIPAGGWVAD